MRAAVLLLASVLVAACADLALGPHPSSPPPIEDLRIAPGDLFDVRVSDEVNVSGNYRVADDGTSRFPLIGVVKVEGLTVPQLEEELTRRLADGYLRSPQVSVFLKESRSRKVTVLGKVGQPGTFPYTEAMSIGEAISRAGGFTALARANRVVVTRSRKDGTQEKLYVAVEDIARGKAPNFYLRPGDLVYVEESLF